MQVVGYSDPEAFLDRIVPWLTPVEASNNLLLGIAASVITRPRYYDVVQMWVAEDGPSPVGAALITPPFQIVLADIESAQSAEFLASAIHRDVPALPGAVGNRPTVEWFTEAWRSLTGCKVRLSMAQGVFALESVKAVPAAKGAPRRASLADLEPLVAWNAAFQAEAAHEENVDPDRVRRATAVRLDDEPTSGLWVWEVAGEQVSMSGFSGPTPNGIRIGPVYTPPAHRGNGYATALVAAQTRWLLERGLRFCFLYTDLANPTANAIYERIGFRRVAESAEYRFDYPGT